MTWERQVSGNEVATGLPMPDPYKCAVILRHAPEGLRNFLRAHLPGEPLMTKMWLKSRGEIQHTCVVNFLGKFSSIDAVETQRMPMP